MNPNKARIIKTIRNVVISGVILLAILIAAGVAYTWYMGQDESSAAATVEVPVAPVAPVVERVKPAANAKVGASVQSVTSPVAPGSNASITIRTTAEALCTISVIYDEVPSTDSGLKPQVADDFGIASWTWTVGPAVPVGKWPVKVTCARDKQSGVVQADLVVALQKS